MSGDQTGGASFRALLLDWAAAACEEWSYPPVDGGWREEVERRLPPGLRVLVADGVERGVIEVVGHRFRPVDLPEKKGPYAFLSRSATTRPAVNWEYFVQLAEYLRVRDAVDRHGLTVAFEDALMDVTVRHGSELLWAIEVKERARQLPMLLDSLREHGHGVDLDTPDRGNDPLRKAKYLVTHRAPYFSLVAIGERRDFSVTYTDDGFELREDFVPYANPGLPWGGTGPWGAEDEGAVGDVTG
jgi:hypothetical protein